VADFDFDTPPPFVPGWDPESAGRARARVMATTGYAVPRADLPVPNAWYIPAFRDMNQGQAGTCHVHAGVDVAESTAQAHGYDVFPICRRLVGYRCGELEPDRWGRARNPSDGGSPSDDITAMSDLSKGVGIAHESLCPYTDDYRTLGTKPPAAVYTDAKSIRLTQPVDVSYSDNDVQLFQTIATNHATTECIAWDPGWDAQGRTFVDWNMRQNAGGHALDACGYALKGVFDNFTWICLRNWHGNIYAPLPPELRAKVPNYPVDMKDKVTEFWVRQDVLAHARAVFGYGERVAVTDLAGLGHLFNLASVLGHVLRR
jgi:hypothetical protein